MFDMIAGSETGAIIASSLSIKNTNSSLDRRNAHYADTALQFFKENADTLYRDAYMSTFVRWFFTLLITTAGGYLGFWLADKFFTIDQYE